MKVRQKSPVCDAVQFSPEAEAWPAGIEARGRDHHYVLLTGPVTPTVGQRGIPGVAPILPGDWVITPPKGRRFVISDADFQEQYDQLDPAPAPG